ncbi:MAG: pyridoxal 5'-phosphate synthase glutaminase subunit PdxT [Firmicutes bacterium]|nr:pyridoxal 5'-phosphate synthase glutaminase subunit PdxT [Bacillota bacterium]
MNIAVLALQGAFIEHRKKLDDLKVSNFEIRHLSDLEKPFDGLILPGGESTVMGKLLKELGLFEPLLKMIKGGLPVMGTCAGLILLAENIDKESGHFKTMPVTIARNAYGRQLGSFDVKSNFADKKNVPMVFIRAPSILKVGDKTEILSQHDGAITAAKYKNQLGITFHPELTEDLTIHKYFMDMIKK